MADTEKITLSAAAINPLHSQMSLPIRKRGSSFETPRQETSREYSRRELGYLRITLNYHTAPSDSLRGIDLSSLTTVTCAFSQFIDYA